MSWNLELQLLKSLGGSKTMINLSQYEKYAICVYLSGHFNIWKDSIFFGQ